MIPFGGFKIPKALKKSSGTGSTGTGIFSELITRKNTWEEYPLLPLRELVIFPQTMMSVYITYKAGINALEEALRRDLKLFAACQKTTEAVDQRSIDQRSIDQRSADLRSTETWDAGTVVRIVQNLRLPDNTFRVVLQGE